MTKVDLIILSNNYNVLQRILLVKGWNIEQGKTVYTISDNSNVKNSQADHINITKSNFYW